MAQVSPPRAENPARRILPVTGHKFFSQILFLFSDLALYPYMGETGARYQVFRMVGAAVTLMSVYAVSFRRGLIFCRSDSCRSRIRGGNFFPDIPFYRTQRTLRWRDFRTSEFWVVDRPPAPYRSSSDPKGTWMPWV
jgi:hypothetical protein